MSWISAFQSKDFELDFFIFVKQFCAFFNAVKHYVQIGHSGKVGEDTSLAVLGHRALMDADSFAVRDVLYERQELLELRRPGSAERVCSCGNEEVRVLDGRAVPALIADRDSNCSRHCFARRGISVECYCDHCYYDICVYRCNRFRTALRRMLRPLQNLSGAIHGSVLAGR